MWKHQVELDQEAADERGASGVLLADKKDQGVHRK